MYQRHNDMLRQSARDSPLVVVSSPVPAPRYTLQLGLHLEQCLLSRCPRLDQDSKAVAAAYGSPLVQHQVCPFPLASRSVPRAPHWLGIGSIGLQQYSFYLRKQCRFCG